MTRSTRIETDETLKNSICFQKLFNTCRFLWHPGIPNFCSLGANSRIISKYLRCVLCFRALEPLRNKGLQSLCRIQQQKSSLISSCFRLFQISQTFNRYGNFVFSFFNCRTSTAKRWFPEAHFVVPRTSLPKLRMLASQSLISICSKLSMSSCKSSTRQRPQKHTKTPNQNITKNDKPTRIFRITMNVDESIRE